jgi:glutaredoxin
MIKYVHNTLKYSIWCKKDKEEILDNQINNSEVLLVGLTWCPWTLRAKELIKEKYNIDPVIIAPDVVDNDYKIEMLQCLSKKVNSVYVPQIWVKGKHIGDFEKLYKMSYRKQIDEMLNDKKVV